MFVRLALALGATLTLGSSMLRAQQPTPAQVQQLLQGSPSMATQLRDRLRASGLSNDQIRARLRAAGYPETMLDSFLPGSDSTRATSPDEVARAMRAVEVADSVAQARGAVSPHVNGQTMTPGGVLPPSTHADSVFLAARLADQSNAIFGLDIFRRLTTQFDPASAGPVDPNYKVGPRDVLALILTGGVEAAYTLDVASEGYVVIPQVGQVFVANLTLDQITDLFYARLGRVYSGLRRSADASTKMSVTVARVRTNQIFVIGDAAVPGSYQISAAGTILTALYSAGGPAANGSLRDVQVRRAGQVVGSLDLYDYLVNGDASHDSRLQSGDVVFVPFRGRHVRVIGEVGRPATYELKEGETLRDVIRFAGGFTPTAARQRVQIRRILDPGSRTDPGTDRVVIDVAADARTGDCPPFPMQAGDQVQVFPIVELERNRIVVSGSVWSPGEQGLQAGMKVSDALRAAGGIRPDAYLDQVLVTRRGFDGSSVQLRTQLADTLGRVIDDLLLRENDSITVYSRADFRPDRFITIAGAVKKEGRIPYREGMTMRDAILAVGGLVEGAYLGSAEVARMPQSRTGGRLADTLRVSLDSSYLFEREPGGKYLGPPGLPTLQSGSAPEVVLKPYDHVLILKQPDFRLERRVKIVGEVRFPGEYALTRRDEKLSDLVERAGGLTTRANADGLRFVRTEGDIGRVDVDLRTAMKNPQSRDNFVLIAGDSIEVPQFMPVVKVTGAVSAATSVAYVPGRDANYYLSAAGGLALNGDRSRMYVMQPSGARELYRKRKLLPDDVPVPLAGSEIVVPVKPEGKTDKAAVVGAVAQIMAGLVTVLVVALRR